MDDNDVFINYISNKQGDNIKKYTQKNEPRNASVEKIENDDAPLYAKYKKVNGFGFFPLKNQDAKGSIINKSPKQNPRLKIDNN